MKTALVLGAGGFIGSHLVKRLKREGFWVRGVDLKRPRYAPSPADDFIVGDLRLTEIAKAAVDRHFDEVYQLAADMGGAGFVFSGANDADIMHNSAQINLNMLEELSKTKPGVVFYSSSACMYPEHNQLDPLNPNCAEASAYPANPDSEYGWEKLFSERLYLAYQRNRGLNVRIGRFHNIFGPEGSWNDGREKAPAALCRKIALAARENGAIEMWGDGTQTRSFLFIDECLEGVLRLTRSDFIGPLNIGSDEMVSLNQFAAMIMAIAGSEVSIKHIPGPLGVRGRNSDNRLIREKLNWAPSAPLRDGLALTYTWIAQQIEEKRLDQASA
jgi:GDP-D-mannose 3', 5'-epimerase